MSGEGLGRSHDHLIDIDPDGWLELAMRKSGLNAAEPYVVEEQTSTGDQPQELPEPEEG